MRSHLVGLTFLLLPTYKFYNEEHRKLDHYKALLSNGARDTDISSDWKVQ